MRTLIYVIQSYSAELPLNQQGQRISKAWCKQLANSSVSLGLDHLPICAICKPDCPLSPYKGEPVPYRHVASEAVRKAAGGSVSVQGLGWSGEVIAQVHDNP